MKKKKLNLLILGSYGRGNVGDDIFLTSAVKLLGNHNLYINSADDDLLPLQAKDKVKTIATEKIELVKKIKTFLKVQHVIYYGGDLWVELHGDKYPRQALYKMLAVNLICKVFRKKVHYLGCGAGNLEGLSLILARLSARLASTVVVRERETAKVLALKSPKILPDLAFTIDSQIKSKSPHVRSSQKIKIGISLLYHLPTPETNFPLALNRITELISSLPEDKFSITFLSMMGSNSNHKDDTWVYWQLKDRLPDRQLGILSSNNIDDYLEVISNMDLVVSARLHANILAILTGTPCLGIAYRKKVERLFKQNNLDEYYVNLEEMDMLKSKFEHMISRKMQIRRQLLEVRKNNIEEASIYKEVISEIF